MIEANIGEFAKGSSKSFKKRNALETLKNNVMMEYNDYIQQGFSGKSAYLKVLTSSSFLKGAVPTLQVTAKPEWMKEYVLEDMFREAGKSGVDVWAKLNETALANLRGYTDPEANDGAGATVAGHNDYNKFLMELEQLDFLEKIFITRFNLGGMKYALEGKAENPLDAIFGDNKKKSK